VRTIPREFDGQVPLRSVESAIFPKKFAGAAVFVVLLTSKLSAKNIVPELVYYDMMIPLQF